MIRNWIFGFMMREKYQYFALLYQNEKTFDECLVNEDRRWNRKKDSGIKILDFYKKMRYL